MLIIENVDFGYRNQDVFNNLNFSMSEGEFVFLTGKSGAGKSTFLQLIYMNLRPDSGEVRFLDFSSKKIKTRKIPKLRRQMGFVFQDFKLLDDRTVFENLSFVLSVTGCPYRQIKKKVFESLALVDLSHKSRNMPGELSGGEKQRVAIARAILNDPALLLADEPTGNLDPQTSSEILQLLKKINSRGTSVLIATHDYSLIRDATSPVFKIGDGKITKVSVKLKGS